MNNVIKGFEFDNQLSYNTAKKELEYINRIKDKIISGKPETILEVYNRIINDGIFITPIGMEYLRGLQKELYSETAIDNSLIRNIPAIIYKPDAGNEKFKADVNIKQKAINVEQIKSDAIKDNSIPDIKEQKTKPNTKKNKYYDKYIKILIINIFLVITIAVMFLITRQANKLDVNYYKESIENNYIEWQNELTERESSINAKENQD